MIYVLQIYAGCHSSLLFYKELKNRLILSVLFTETEVNLAGLQFSSPITFFLIFFFKLTNLS